MANRTLPWARIYNIFDPFSPLVPGQIDKLFVERPHSPLARLRYELGPDHLPQRMLLVGQPSSGKSTELARLATDLGRQEIMVVRIDLDQNLDASRVNPVETLFLMGLAIYKVGQVLYGNVPGKAPGREPVEEMSRALEAIVTKHTEIESPVDLAKEIEELICFTATGVAGAITGPAGAAMTGAAVRGIAGVTRRLPFVSGTTAEIVRKTEVAPTIRVMADALNQLIADLEAKANKPLTILVDGLDRLQDPNLVRLLFADEQAFLNSPSCRVVCIAPSLVAYDREFGVTRARFNIFRFPNVQLHEPRAQRGRDWRDDAGWETMQAICDKRLAFLGLARDQVVDEAALEILIQRSGGNVRDFIRLFRSATVNAQIVDRLWIDEPAAEEAFWELRRLYDAQLRPTLRQILDRVAKTNQLTDDPDCDRLLYSSIILNYTDHENWYDVHAVLW
jgi:hypothetical protein